MKNAMVRLVMWMCGLIGCLGVFNWFVARALFPDGPIGQWSDIATNPAMLVLGLVFMVLGLAFAGLLRLTGDNSE